MEVMGPTVLNMGRRGTYPSLSCVLILIFQKILLPLVVVLFDHFSTSGISRSDDRVQRMIWILSPVGLLTLASAVQAMFIPLPRSTYICANVTHGAWMVPASQILSLVLDFGILRAFEMFLRPSRLQGSIATSFASTSFTFLVCV